jgi:hypothetical protein
VLLIGTFIVLLVTIAILVFYRTETSTSHGIPDSVEYPYKNQFLNQNDPKMKDYLLPVKYQGAELKRMKLSDGSYSFRTVTNQYLQLDSTLGSSPAYFQLTKCSTTPGAYSIVPTFLNDDSCIDVVKSTYEYQDQRNVVLRSTNDEKLLVALDGLKKTDSISVLDPSVQLFIDIDYVEN